MSFDPEQREFEAKKKMAMLNSGHKHILLILKNEGRINLAGIDVLIATPTSDLSARKQTFKFRIDGGGARFEIDDNLGGEYAFHMLDTKRNRRLLATHLPGNYWRIDDKEIEKEIKKLRKTMATENVTQEQPSEFMEKIKKMEQLYSDLQVADDRDIPTIQLKMTKISEQLGEFDGDISPSEKLGAVRKKLQKPIVNPQKAQKLKNEMIKLTKETEPTKETELVNVE